MVQVHARVCCALPLDTPYSFRIFLASARIGKTPHSPMKLALALAGGLAIAMADQVPTQQPANSTSQGGSNTVKMCLIAPGIFPPKGGIYNWYYNSRAEGPYSCTAHHDTELWAMLAAYRSGGTQGVHWKYTDNPDDSECLTNWTYYSSDGNTVIESSIGRTTSSGDTRRWCALPVYRTGGVKGKQWGYCVFGC